MKSKLSFTVLYLTVMILVIIGLDLTLFRDQFLVRLIGNITVVAVFLVAYLFITRKTK